MTCFAPARIVILAVKRAYAIALTTRCPTVFSPPSCSSVTLWEETARQTTHQALSVTLIQGPTLEHQNYKGGISRTTPPHLAHAVS